jgi:hypothetical protein
MGQLYEQLMCRYISLPYADIYQQREVRCDGPKYKIDLEYDQLVLLGLLS